MHYNKILGAWAIENFEIKLAYYSGGDLQFCGYEDYYFENTGESFDTYYNGLDGDSLVIYCAKMKQNWLENYIMAIQSMKFWGTEVISDVVMYTEGTHTLEITGAEEWHRFGEDEPLVTVTTLGDTDVLALLASNWDEQKYNWIQDSSFCSQEFGNRTTGMNCEIQPHTYSFVTSFENEGSTPCSILTSFEELTTPERMCLTLFLYPFAYKNSGPPGSPNKFGRVSTLARPDGVLSFFYNHNNNMVTYTKESYGYDTPEFCQDNSNLIFSVSPRDIPQSRTYTLYADENGKQTTQPTMTCPVTLPQTGYDSSLGIAQWARNNDTKWIKQEISFTMNSNTSMTYRRKTNYITGYNEVDKYGNSMATQNNNDAADAGKLDLT